MPIYYFHFRDAAGKLRPDRVGSELADNDEATVEAVRSSSELARFRKRNWQACAFEVRDDAGGLVATVPFWRH